MTEDTVIKEEIVDMGEDIHLEIKQEQKEKTLSNYTYQISGRSNLHEFTKITQYLINVLKQKYTYGTNVAYALENPKECDLSPYKLRLKSLSQMTQTQRKLKMKNTS